MKRLAIIYGAQLPVWLNQFFIALLYALLGILVRYIVPDSQTVSIIWPSSGIALAVLLIGGPRYILGVFVGALVLGVFLQRPPVAIAGIAFANVVEPLFAYWLLTKILSFSLSLRKLSDFLKLIFVSGVASLLNAIIAILFLNMSGLLEQTSVVDTLIHRWMGHAIGIVFITTLMLVWRNQFSKTYHVKQWLEATLLIGASVLVGQVIFLGWFQESLGLIARGYWEYMVISFIAIRLGARGVTLLLIIVAIQGLAGALNGVGYFGHDIKNTGLINYWYYLMTLSVVGMVLVTYVNELKETIRSLQLKDLALNSAANGIVISDHAGKVQWANPAFTKQTGYSLNEAEGKVHSELVKSGIHDTSFYQHIWDTVHSNKEWHGEITNRRKDGTLFDEEMTITPIKNEEGKISNFVTIKQDISLRKQVEAQFRQVIEAAPNAMIIVNNQGFITLINSETCTLFGYSKEELIGKTVNLLLPQEFQHGHLAQVKEFIEVAPSRRKMGVGRELFAQHKDGRKFPIEVGLSPMQTIEGRFVIATVIDITERKEKENEAQVMREQLAQASKMESIGHLTAGIAHDFNNILGAMMGYSELSQHMLAAGKSEAIPSYQEAILKSGTRAKELIRQMLTFSRLSPDEKGGKAPVNDIKLIIKEVINLLRPSIPSSITLHYWEENEQLKARILPIHLHQILLNLVVNARDALNGMGNIDITLSRQRNSKHRCSSCKMPFAGDFVQIAVRDNGCGIPEDTLMKIFAPFFTTKGVGKGTGMGLSVIHGLVHAQEGHIYVESIPYEGTTFNILLPVELSETCEPEVIKASSFSNIKNLRVMVVDDEYFILNMLKDYLDAQGAQLTAFADPQKALDEFTLNPGNFDIVITDETMPGMSGMTLSQKLLSIKSNLPIILCTGFSEYANPESVAEIGIAGFFHKPVNLNELVLKIQTLCKA